MRTSIVLLFSLILLAGIRPAEAGSDALLWCRGGPDHGDTCAVDGDCDGGDSTTTGICTRRGMPRACIGTHYCSVSQTIECRGNDDCTTANGGTWPDNPADYCFSFEMNISGCDPASADTAGAGDCGECAGGTFKGKGCLGNGHCPASTCDKSAGLGNCSNGASQCELQWFGHRGYGSLAPHDIIADFAVGPPIVGGNIERTTTAGTMVSPAAIEISGDELYVSERRRITRRGLLAASASNNVDATGFIGQVDDVAYLPYRIGDDFNVSIIPISTAETLNTIFATGTTVYRPIHCSDSADLDGCLVGDLHRLLLHPDPMGTDSAATQVWGHTNFEGSRTFDDAKKLFEVSGLATMRRCVGGAAIGTPCSINGDCAASTCATTIAVAADTAGLTYTSTYTIASGDVGPIKYVIALADSAGNTASIDQTDSTRAAGMLLWFGMHLA